MLLVEDEDTDAFFVKRAIEKSDARHTLRVVKNGQEAIDYLKGEDQYSNRQEFPLPNVVLADLKMPIMGGFEFLQWLREHPHTAVVPTIIYSNSNLEEDVRRAYQLGANSFITKPTDMDLFVDVLRLIRSYWSLCECLPRSLGFNGARIASGA